MDLATHLGEAELRFKDESVRSPMGSFKALGAPIALVRLIHRLFPSRGFQAEGLLAGDYLRQVNDFTIISATDGNHGRALAAAAPSVGCRCVIVLHANVSLEREQAIAPCGAEIVRITCNYASRWPWPPAWRARMAGTSCPILPTTAMKKFRVT